MRKAGLVLLVWAGFAGLNLWYCRQAGITPLELFYQGVDWMRAHPAGPLVFCLVFCLRPFLLLPASLLSISAGFCFGAGWGVFWANLAATLAAGLGYGLGRWLGLRGASGRAVEALRRHGVTAVVAMRWCFLPYDLVSYLAGALRLPLGRFLLGSTMGNLPGTTSCVLFGASVQGSLRNGAGAPIDWRLQAGSVALFLVMLLLSRWARRRFGSPEQSEENPGNLTDTGC